MNENVEFPCYKCKRSFKTFRGSMKHLRQCKVIPTVNNDDAIADDETPHDPIQTAELDEKLYWGEVKGSIIEQDINESYEKIVFWKNNIFLLPNGGTSKNFIREITRLLNAWAENSPLKDISMKAIHIMPALLLQKVSKSTKSSDHAKTLER